MGIKAVILSISTGATVALIALGCASKPCREPTAPASGLTAQPQTTETMSTARPAPDAPKKDKASEKIKVAKANGSVQCEGGAIPLDRMQKELGSITVYSKSVQNDGLMRPQVCGAGTGAHNVYEIDAKDLPLAQSLGFRVWKK